MTTTTIDFRARIKQEYGVSDSQLDSCQRWERGDGSAFYTVESASVPGQYYRVEWNAVHHVVQCKPHSGQPCKAAQNGLTCWHRRASLAAERLFKYEQACARRREAEAIERTAAYQREQVERQVAEAEAIVNGAREAEKREAQAVKRSGARAYERREFSLLK